MPRRDVRVPAIMGTIALVTVLGFVIADFDSKGTGVWRRIVDQADDLSTPDRLMALFGQEDPEIRARFEQGVVMLHAKRYEHAVTAFHRVLALSPKMPEAHVNMGYALHGLGRHRAAADFFTSAIALNKDQINAYYGLALASDSLGDLPAAVGAMRTYVHLTRPDDPYHRKGWAALWELESRLRASRGEPPLTVGPADSGHAAP